MIRGLKYIQSVKRLDKYLVFALMCSFHAFCGDTPQIEQLRYGYEFNYRSIDNHIPDDDIIPVPLEPKIWLEYTFVHDEAGILQRMQDEFREWERLDEQSRLWNLDDVEFNRPDEKERKNRITKDFVKYVDRRLSGEIKRAEKGSTLAKVGTVRQALKPTTKVTVNRYLKVKFKARVLQGQLKVNFINPFVGSYADIDRKGGVKFHMFKNFEEVGMTSKVDYFARDKSYVFLVSKDLIENIGMYVSSTQSQNQMIFESRADAVLGFNYDIAF